MLSLGKIFCIHAIMHIVLCDELHNFEASGLEASVGEFPAMVSIQSAHLNKGHICCGTIINTHFVMTPASCYARIPPKVIQTFLFVVIGGVSIAIEELGRQQTLRVKKILYHPRYNHTPLNDIALLYVQQKIKYIPNITTNIAIANEKTTSIKDGTVCQTAGWRVVNKRHNDMQGSTQYNRLIKYDMKVVDKTRCPCSNKSEECYQDGFCMLAVSKSTSIICFGFGGNPLICGGVLFGIRSEGHKCMSEENGIIFMTITPYFEWIKSIITAHSRRLNRINTSNSVLAMDLWTLITTTVTLKF